MNCIKGCFIVSLMKMRKVQQGFERMLQAILRSRPLFLIILSSLWLLIFAIPYFGRVHRKDITRGAKNVANSILGGAKRSFNLGNSQTKKTDDIVQAVDKKLESNSDDYKFAGEFMQGKLCLDNLDGTIGSVIGMWECHGEGGNQFWFIKKNQNLKSKNLCAEGPKDLDSIGTVKLQRCSNKPSQSWEYIKDHNLIKLLGSNLCIEANEMKKAFLNRCDKKRSSQKWTLKSPPGM